MNSLARTRKVALILAAAPVAWFAAYMSWLIVPQIVRIVAVKVAESVATGR
jgi:hypothetical protein